MTAVRLGLGQTDGRIAVSLNAPQWRGLETLQDTLQSVTFSATRTLPIGLPRLLNVVTVMVARGVNGVLQFETRRADSGGRVFAAEAASPLPISKGVWEALLSFSAGSGAEARPLNDIPVLRGIRTAYSATLLRVNSCRSLSIWQQGGGVCKPPLDQKLHEQGGFINCSTGVQRP